MTPAMIALATTLAVASVATPPASDDAKKQAAGTTDPEIDRLIKQLGSKKFAERDAAAKRLQEIGKRAIPALRRATKNDADAEVRQAARNLIGLDLEEMFQEGIRQETVLKDYKKAVETFEKIADLMHLHDPTYRFKQSSLVEEPDRSLLFLHLGRSRWGAEQFNEAARAYHQACYYASPYELRAQIEQEWSACVSKLVEQWKKEVLKKLEANAQLKALADKHVFVLLHSRRFTVSGYLNSVYSFVYETSDEKKHGGDVQLLFDNGGGDRRIMVHMSGGQQNLIADLGEVDFEKDHDPRKVDITAENTWLGSDCEAIEGHVYLERVRDTRGNRFFVQFKVLAVDPNSRYMAFVWRRLPGGKVVR